MQNRLQRVLVLFSTVSGCTETIARRIGADLIAFGVRPTVASVTELPQLKAGSFDAVIMGSGVRVGRWHKEARDWVARNFAAFSKLPKAFFSVGLHGVKTDGSIEQSVTQADQRRILASVGIDCTAGSAFFSGWKRQEGFSNLEKMALRVYPLADGDYRDWNAVDAWVHDMAPKLLKQARAVERGKSLEQAVASSSSGNTSNKGTTNKTNNTSNRPASSSQRGFSRTHNTTTRRGGDIAASVAFEECRA